jgi:hypothetical protein
MELTSVFICAIVFGAIYKMIELFVRRKERLKLIDKIVELPPEFLASRLATLQDLNSWSTDSDRESSRFMTLRWGCLIGGLGLGMIIGGSVVFGCSGVTYAVRNMISGGSVLLCGSLGLIVSFIIEYNIRRKGN